MTRIHIDGNATEDMLGKVKQAMADAPAETRDEALVLLERIAGGVERIGDQLAAFLDPPGGPKLVDCQRCAGEGTIAGAIQCVLCDGSGKVEPS